MSNESNSTSSSDTPADIITPWTVEGQPGSKGIDYSRVLKQFQSQPVDSDVVAAVAGAVGGQHALHHFFKRGIAFSHRELDKIVASYVKKDPRTTKGMFLYTGRGPSSASMHLGHIVPFMLTKYLQDVVFPGAPLVVQLTDDEKFLFRDVPLPDLRHLARENLKDILAMGINQQRTFAFLNTDYIQRLYPTTLQIQRRLTANAVANTFGFTDSDNVGKYAYPAVQAAPCFSGVFPVVLGTSGHTRRALIPCAIDQDPFFVLTRHVAQSMKAPKPALVHSTFVPALKGAHLKMSSSKPNDGVIYLSDSDDVVRKKLKSAHSGGRGTLEEFKRLGGDADRDVALQLLRYFCEDDAKVESLTSDYAKGLIGSGAMKELAGDVVIALLRDWRERRAAVTESVLDMIMTERPLE